MKRCYVKPCMYQEKFQANEYVATCYELTTNIAAYCIDSNDNKKYDNGELRQPTSGTITLNRIPETTNVYLSNKLNATGWWAIINFFATLIGENKKYTNTTYWSSQQLYIADGYASTTRPTQCASHPNRS